MKQHLNNKGVTLIELIVSFALVAVAIIYFYQTLYTVRKLYGESQKETNNFVDVNYAYRIVDAKLNTNINKNIDVCDFNNFPKSVVDDNQYVSCKFNSNNNMYTIEFKVNGESYVLYKYKPTNTDSSNQNNNNTEIVIDNIKKSNILIPNVNVFKGADPNNYVKIEKDTFRIISINDNKLKLIDYSYDKTSYWDNYGARYNSNNTFCQTNANDKGSYYNKTYGCNVFAKRDGILQRVVQHNRASQVQGTVNDNSTLYETLRSYYNSISNTELKKLIIKDATWNTGSIKYSNGKATIDNIVSNEKTETSVSPVGLINVSDYIYASNVCNNSKYVYGDSVGDNCKKDNWLYHNQDEWTINADDGNTWFVSKINKSKGYLTGYYASSKLLIKPVFYITNFSITSGDGTKDSPYIIVAN